MTSTLCCFDTVSTSEVVIIERFGKFNRLGEAGCVCVICPIEFISGKVSLRIQELNVELETKTKDNVFVIVKVSVQYQAIREKIYSAFYVLSELDPQMTAYVFDVVRAALCTMTLDHAFESKEEISTHLKSSLTDVMSTYGFAILNALVTDLAPDRRVKDAMNEINASKRMKEAAFQRAEGEKIVKVKKAEAEAESMYLQGVGVARQRKAIMDGLKESIVMFSDDVKGTSAKDIMDLLVLTQYFDTLQEIGRNDTTKVIYLPNDDQPIRGGILQANSALGH